MSKQERLREAMAQYPGMDLSLEQLELDLRALGWENALPQNLESVALCSAGSRGDRIACAALESHLLAEVRPAILRVNNNPDFVAEVLQRLRERLLTGTSPKIRTYTGRGPLVAWLKVVARRLALDLVRAVKPGREQPLDTPEARQIANPNAGPEPLKDRYAPLFKQVLSEVLEALPPNDRTMLRLQLVEGLSAAAIAKIFDTHPATVYRRLERCNKSILESVRKRLRQQLGPVSQSEVRSLFGMVEADLNLSLTRLLRPAEDAS